MGPSAYFMPQRSPSAGGGGRCLKPLVSLGNFRAERTRTFTPFPGKAGKVPRVQEEMVARGLRQTD